MLMTWKPTFAVGDLKQDTERNFISLSNHLYMQQRQLDSKNVTSLDTDRTSIKSNDGSTEIVGPLLEMYDNVPTLRIKMGLDRSDDVFKYSMYNAAGDETVSIDGSGNAIFSGELSIGTGDDICRITADGLWLGNATRTSAPFQVTKAGVMSLTGTSSSLSVGSGNTIAKMDSNGIYCGNATFASAPFNVTPAGVMTLSGASSSLSVGSGNTIAKMDSNGIYCGNATFASAPFNVTPAGVMTLSGTSSSLSVGSGNTIAKMDSNGIYCGNATFASAPFRVSPAGVLTATSATISGTITGSSFNTNVGGTDTNYIQIDDNGFIGYEKVATVYKKNGLCIESSGWGDSNFYFQGYPYLSIESSLPGVSMKNWNGTGTTSYEFLYSANDNTYANGTLWDFTNVTNIDINGVSGTFTTVDSKTVTVTGGLITSIV